MRHALSQGLASSVALPSPAANGDERALLRLDADRERLVPMPVPVASALVVLCVRGRIDLHTVFGVIALLPGEAFVASGEHVARIGLRERAHGALALANDEVLQAIDVPPHAAEPLLFTRLHRADPEFSRLASGLAEVAAGSETSVAASVLARAFALDRDLDALVGRCPGRSLAQRRQALARFERTRNRIRFAANPDYDVGTLARHTNYTRWHFVRVFQQIYGEAPAQWLLQLRREACERLLAAPTLAIADVAALAGFSSHAAFSRWFRASYGMTASEWRLRAGARGAR